MKTCNDCIHCEACISQVPRTFWDSETFYDGCKYFKDKSRFIELPCNVGDTVYQIDTERGITFYFDEDGTANVLNEDYLIYCANEETLEMVKEAVKKHIPKEPLNPCGRYYGSEKGGTCPCCGAHTNSETYNYCRKCGQALDWSDIV